MVNNEVILRKIGKLKEYVGELRRAQDITWEKYQKDIRARAFVERYIHIAIQNVFDIANHIIAYQGWKEPDTYREAFGVLAEKGILPDDKVSDFQNMASFRNMLVHHYEKVDNELVFGIFKDRLGDFDLFCELILEYMKNLKRNRSHSKG
jgi:uncharacterized protein YutE (UPF0331/DUF86 family)